MANGYSKIYGDSAIVVNNICGYGRTYHHLFGDNTLGNSLRFWTILGE